MMKGVDIAGNAIVSRPLETSRSAEYYVQHLLLVLDSIRSVKRGEILLEEDFTARRDRVSIPYDEAERLIREYLGPGCSDRRIFHFMAYAAIIAYYWFVWALLREVRGIDNGDALERWRDIAIRYAEHLLPDA